jgi:hypothetical protein
MTMPSPTPMIMAPTVPMIVPFHRPSRTGVWFMIWKAKPQSHRLLVMNELSIIATTMAMSANATHRHGCRTGRASMRPGRSVALGALT